MFWANTFNTLPDASRPAMPLGSAGKTGKLRSQPAGKFAPLHLIDFGRRVRGTRRDRRQTGPSTCSWASAPRSPMPGGEMLATPSGTRNLASSGQP